MRQNLSTLIVIAGAVLAFSACGSKDQGKSRDKGPDPKAQPAEPGANTPPGMTAEKPGEPKPATVAEPKPAANATGPKEMKKLGDFVDAWTSRYQANEAAVNAFEGMPIMELVSPALLLAIGPQFDLLNPDGADGRFEGQLVMAGKKGFIEKKGAVITFGYSHTLDKDGFGPTAKKGDVQILEGAADLALRSITLRSRTERDGKKITATQTEYRLLADGSMLCLSLNGHAIDGKGDPSKFSNFIFLHNGDKKYDFVVAKAEFGPELPAVTMAEKGDLDKAKAAALATASGYTVEKTGGVVDGKLVLDK
ncbi:MAG: hypothetical protein CVU59_05915 [Deltaproteobacteria bacterium HGW-Deltaproteobacteria-17]|nr:MAG: hypothetical protein CVU59_05915 [Deltaproteobacteria bacterium HGW-Deltaproteobacteria-17]